MITTTTATLIRIGVSTSDWASVSAPVEGREITPPQEPGLRIYLVAAQCIIDYYTLAPIILGVTDRKTAHTIQLLVKSRAPNG